MGYPTLRLLLPDGTVEAWQGALNRAEDVISWVTEAAAPSEVRTLTTQNWSEVTSSNSSWLVMWGAQWCGPCNQLKAPLKAVAARLARLPRPVHVGAVGALSRLFHAT